MIASLIVLDSEGSYAPVKVLIDCKWLIDG
jgi:hypothetical protein